jgi:hypothetical protein
MTVRAIAPNNGDARLEHLRRHDAEYRTGEDAGEHEPDHVGYVSARKDELAGRTEQQKARDDDRRLGNRIHACSPRSALPWFGLPGDFWLAAAYSA